MEVDKQGFAYVHYDGCISHAERQSGSEKSVATEWQTTVDVPREDLGITLTQGTPLTTCD